MLYVDTARVKGITGLLQWNDAYDAFSRAMEYNRTIHKVRSTYLTYFIYYKIRFLILLSHSKGPLRSVLTRPFSTSKSKATDMPKNNKRAPQTALNTQSLPLKDGPDQEYGRILKILGGNWLTAQCSDGLERRCHIRGVLQRFKTSTGKLEVGDIILLSKRDDDKLGDVLLKYPSDLARRLIKQKIIVLAQTPDPEDENITADIEFDYDESESTLPLDLENI